MLYKINRSVPANTTAAAPDWQKLQVCKGTIKEWIVFCPEECADLMKFKVEYQGHQIFPVSRDEWMDALQRNAPILENLELKVAPFVLDINAYNLDDLYSHEYNIYVNILRDEPFVPPKSSFNIRAAWSNILGGKS
jgi:hypothetical protein